MESAQHPLHEPGLSRRVELAQAVERIGIEESGAQRLGHGLAGWTACLRATGTTAPAATTAQRIFGAARGDLNRPAVGQGVRRVTEAALAAQATPTILAMPGVARSSLPSRPSRGERDGAVGSGAA
jgi:hypothetical protein